MHMKLLDPNHLRLGSERQKLVLAALEELKVFTELGAYSPVLAGAVALDVDVPTSQIEVVCFAENLETFADKMKNVFSGQAQFALDHSVIGDWPTVVVSFRYSELPFLISAQSRTVFQQPAVLQLLVQARLLAFSPAEARGRIRALKSTGSTTEQAFADCYGLKGEPSAELAKIANLPDRDILHIAHRFIFSTH